MRFLYVCQSTSALAGVGAAAALVVRGFIAGAATAAAAGVFLRKRTRFADGCSSQRALCEAQETAASRFSADLASKIELSRAPARTFGGARRKLLKRPSWQQCGSMPARSSNVMD